MSENNLQPRNRLTARLAAGDTEPVYADQPRNRLIPVLDAKAETAEEAK